MSLKDFNSTIHPFALTPAQKKESAETYAKGGMTALLAFLDGKVRRGKPPKAVQEAKEWLQATEQDVRWVTALAACRFGMNGDALRFAERLNHQVMNDGRITQKQRRLLATKLHRYRKQTGEAIDQEALKWLSANGS